MGSFQTPIGMRNSTMLETSCGFLLQELQARAKIFPSLKINITTEYFPVAFSFLFFSDMKWKQIIWDEVGEDQFEREKVLLDLEQECLQVYKRKVDRANISRARLHQELAEAEAEFTHLLLTLGERSLPGRVTTTLISLQLVDKPSEPAIIRSICDAVSYVDY